MKMLIFGIGLLAISSLVIGQPLAVPIAENPPLELHRLDIINSPYRETNLSITPDGKYLYFMSLRGGMPWSVEDYSYYKGIPRFDGDIWFSKKVDGAWQPPKCLPPPINTATAEDEPNVSADGNYVIYQSWKDTWASDGGPYYQSALYGENWGKPQGLSGGINQYFKIEFRKFDGYATDGASVAPNGNLFMVALAPYYDDSMDIYQSVKNTDNIWTYLTKTNLSTDGDERSLFIAADNKTVYFASDGYVGLGGLDIYKATISEDGTFVNIINLGEPFNSPEDDYSFIISASGDDAYFIRDGDIMYCDLSIASSDIKPLPSAQIRGKIFDLYGKPLEADVHLKRTLDNQLKGKTRSDSKTGDFSLSFNYEKVDYHTEISSNGFKEQRISLSLDSTKKFQTIEYNLGMVPENMLLVHFDFNHYELKKDDIEVLDSLVKALYQNRSLRLAIDGHTDDIGSDPYNLELSRKRVDAVSGYLKKQGIPGRIMKLNYFGESRPKVGKHVPNYDAINRRVEIRVIDFANRNK